MSRTRLKRHASTTLFESLENRAEPTSTGTMFQPGQWAPGKNEPARKEDEQTFEPESWMPPGNKASKK